MNGDVTSIDPRLLTVTFAVNGKLNTFTQDFTMRVGGKKYANPLQNECEVEIYNLDRDTRNYLLTETSPFNANRTPKILNVYAGRVSTGTFLVYTGDIATSTITQPPDIGLKLKCGTAHFLKGKIGGRSGGKSGKLDIIAHGVATNLGLTLNNQAKNRTVSNYQYNGDALGEVVNLQQAGVDAFVDDGQLVLKEAGLPLSGSAVDLSENTGMIGVPEVTEKGLKVTFLFNSAAKLGGAIKVTSQLNPAANGLFVIYKLNFKLDSREKNFYYIAECLKAKQ